jgi:heat shock protein HslJ
MATGLCCIAISVTTLSGCTGTAKTGTAKPVAENPRLSPSDADGASASRDSTRSTASLENIYWKAIRLGGHDVVVPEGTREPHFVLHAEDHHVAGTGGCNQFSGNYATAGDSLTFSALASTMMACAEPTMTQEKWLTDALSQARTWRITGEQLELLRDGKVIGTFVSVYLK